MSEVSRLIEFVDRIKSRRGFASKEEIFVELIGFSNHFVSQWLSEKKFCKDTHCPSCMKCITGQITLMWNELQKIAEKYKQIGYVESIDPSQGCSLCHINKPYINKKFQSDKCFKCLFDGARDFDYKKDIMCKICQINPRYKCDNYSSSLCSSCHYVKYKIDKTPDFILINYVQYPQKSCEDCGEPALVGTRGKPKKKCKKCQGVYYRERKKMGLVKEKGTGLCSMCGIKEKYISPQSGIKSGYCIQCVRIKNREMYHKNKEKMNLIK